jgi:SpoVK/Ycf46/Vps4 family AAA+-type ATPase
MGPAPRRPRKTKRAPTLVLFAGPSLSARKSAAALARASGRHLMRVALSSVVSKYIGETEKNLSRVFARAEKANAVLFFDEADSLFGKRTEVSDSHDRFANIDTNYLLQRLEEFNGPLILALRDRNAIASAFVRRFAMVVDFASSAPIRRERKPPAH